MQLLLRLVATFLALSTVMLAVSLLVMILIRILHYLADRRAKGLGEMLAALSFSWRSALGEVAASGDLPEGDFVLDILCHPLQSSSPSEREGALAERLRATPREVPALARRVESLSREQLLAIAGCYAEQGVLPARWCPSAPDEARGFEAFATHVREVFPLVEQASTRAFRAEARRLSWFLSCVVALLLNLDALVLTQGLYESQEARRVSLGQAPGLLEMAERFSVGADAHSDRQALLDDLALDLTQLNSVVRDPLLELGWRHSRLQQAFCRYRGDCRPAREDGRGVSPGEDERLSLAGLLGELARWLLGLSLSVWMLGQGPPFWADLLKRFFGQAPARIQNAVARA